MRWAIAAVFLAAGVGYAGGGFSGFPASTPVNGASVQPSFVTTTGIDAGVVQATDVLITANDGTQIRYTGDGSSSTPNRILSGVTAANASTTVPAFQIIPVNALDATDLVWCAGTNNGTKIGICMSYDTKAHLMGDLVADNASADINAVRQVYQTAPVGTAASGTGITVNYSGKVPFFSHRVTVINTALAAAGTSDVTLHTTPVNTRITRVTADVTQVFTGGALSAMTVQCGNTAGGTQYLLAGSVFTAQTTLGDVAAEIGAGLLDATRADMGTPAAGIPGAITVQCRFTCTGANCNAATQGSVTFYVEGVTY